MQIAKSVCALAEPAASVEAKTAIALKRHKMKKPKITEKSSQTQWMTRLQCVYANAAVSVNWGLVVLGAVFGLLLSVITLT